MIDINNYIRNFDHRFPSMKSIPPWLAPQSVSTGVLALIETLTEKDFLIKGMVAIHRSAHVEEGVIMKGPVVIFPGCFIAAHAYLRGGVFLGEKTTIGPGCEIKTSLVFDSTSIAHFNFVGDSIVGSSVNMEAGSVVANHFNERADKKIIITIDGNKIQTGITKFGALIGDDSKIGANAVLSPGTILKPGYHVRRLELVDQNPS